MGLISISDHLSTMQEDINQMHLIILQPVLCGILLKQDIFILGEEVLMKKRNDLHKFKLISPN